MALAACCAQFPRACSGCRRVHHDFASYLDATSVVGAPMLDPDDDEEGAIGLLCFANCGCGTTLAIRYEDVSRHAAFNAAVRETAATSGQPLLDVLETLVAGVRRRARSASPPPAAFSAPDPRVLEAGAAMMAILARGSVVVPPFPGVAFKVAELARAPDSSPEQIGREISSDATLAAEVLQLVNAPIYSRGHPVTSLTMAVKRLGLKEVARLAMATGVGAATARPGALAPVRLQLWHRSVTTATVCRALGAVRGLNPDESFLAGLLQPLGAIVGTLSLEIFLDENPSFPAQPLAFWLRVLEVFRAELGAVTATRWKLPKSLSEVIGLTAGVPNAGSASPALLELVATAAAVSHAAAEVGEVSAAKLTGVGTLTTSEASQLARALPQLVETIAALEESTRPNAVLSKVLAADPPKTLEPVTPELFVVNARRREERFRVSGRGERALVLEGPHSLPVNVLAALEFVTQPPLSICAVTTSCTATPQGQRVVVAPFALSPEAARRLAL